MCTGGEIALAATTLGVSLWGSERAAGIAEQQERAAAAALKQQQLEMARAEKLAREQMAMQERLAANSAALYEQAINRANPRKPSDASGSLDRETQAGRGGPASTLLTGPGGVHVEELQLGRQSLLGA